MSDSNVTKVEENILESETAIPDDALDGVVGGKAQMDADGGGVGYQPPSGAKPPATKPKTKP